MTRTLTDRELKILAAWWFAKGSTKAASDMLNIGRQSIRNQLWNLRRLHGASTNLDLVLRFMDEIEPLKGKNLAWKDGRAA